MSRSIATPCELALQALHLISLAKSQRRKEVAKETSLLCEFFAPLRLRENDIAIVVQVGYFSGLILVIRNACHGFPGSGTLRPALSMKMYSDDCRIVNGSAIGVTVIIHVSRTST